MHNLRINVLDTCPNRQFVLDYYQNKVNNISYNRDCGVDLIFPEDRVLPVHRVTKCGLGIACEFIPSGQEISGPFDLVARSSISNTPLVLTNSVGIFDPGYRGEIIAALRCLLDQDHISTLDKTHYQVKKGDRLVQIVSPDRKPIQVQLVDQLTATERGANGFGSTNQPKTN